MLIMVSLSGCRPAPEPTADPVTETPAEMPAGLTLPMGHEIIFGKTGVNETPCVVGFNWHETNGHPRLLVIEQAGLANRQASPTRAKDFPQGVWSPTFCGEQFEIRWDEWREGWQDEPADEEMHVTILSPLGTPPWIEISCDGLHKGIDHNGASDACPTIP